MTFEERLSKLEEIVEKKADKVTAESTVDEQLTEAKRIQSLLTANNLNTILSIERN